MRTVYDCFRDVKPKVLAYPPRKLFDVKDEHLAALLRIPNTAFLSDTLESKLSPTLARIMRQGVGIEVEVERALGMNIRGWQTKRDDSLRNGGIEYVTTFGMRVRDSFEPVQQLCAAIARAKENQAEGDVFEFSERTSIHVHLDCRKMTPKEIKALILLYALFEDSLFGIAGEARKHNIFCVPLRYISIERHRKGNTFQDFVLGWKKYCALNLLRLHDFGTIEFRHMEGNANYKRIMSWVLILAHLVDYARMNSLAAIMEEIKRLKYISHYQVFAEAVFQSMAPVVPIFQDQMDEAVSDAKTFFGIPAN